MTRRTVLVTSALVALLSGGMGWLGQQLVGIRTRPEDVNAAHGRRPGRPAGAPASRARVKGISAFRTPVDKMFYRLDIDTAPW